MQIQISRNETCKHHLCSGAWILENRTRRSRDATSLQEAAWHKFPVRNEKATLWCGHPQGIKTQIPHGHIIPVFSWQETHSHYPGHPQQHRMGRGKCVPKGWHIPKGLIRAALPWGCSPGNRHLPKGLGLGRRFLQIPGLGNPREPAEVFDGGDGAC